MTIDLPQVSVLVTTYNQEKTIAQTLLSILDQEVDFLVEIIIGDDCSTDGTQEVCRGFVTQYPNKVRLFVHETNIGLMENFAFLISKAKGEFIADCAGDDFWHNRSRLQIQVNYLQQNLDVGMVHGGAIHFNENSGISSERLYPNTKITLHDLLVEKGMEGTTYLVRSKVLSQYVSISEYIKLGFLMEDYPMWFDLFANTKVTYLPILFATYRISNHTLSRPKDIKRQIAFNQNLYKIKHHFVKKYKLQGFNHVQVFYNEDYGYIKMAFRQNKVGDFFRCFLKANFFRAIVYYFYLKTRTNLSLNS